MTAEPESAAEVLFRARMLGHLSQVELAKRAGLTQSVISAYESGRRQPSLPALANVVDASGHELIIELAEIPERFRSMNGPIGRRVRLHRAALKAVAAGAGASNLRVFGSVARGEDRPDSDVDLLVDLPSPMGLVGLMRLSDELESIVDAKVDLIPADGLKPYVRERVMADLISL